MSGVQKIPPRGIRGIRDQIPSGYVLGRSSTGDGRAELIPIGHLASKINETGIITVGSVGGSTYIKDGTGRPPLNTFPPGTIYAQHDGTVGARIWVNQTGGGGTPINVQQLSDGAIHQYLLNDVSGTTIIDTGSSPVNGTYNGGFSLGQKAIAGSTFVSTFLNGTNGYAALGIKDPGSGGSWTLECVFQPAGVIASSGRFIANDHTDSNSKGLQVFENGGQKADVGFSISGSPSVGSATNYVLGTTYLVDLVYDSVANQLIFYVNGVASSPTSVSGTYVPATAGLLLNLGRNPSYNGDFVEGYYSCCALYNTVLSATKISNHFNGLIPEWIAIPGV